MILKKVYAPTSEHKVQGQITEGRLFIFKRSDSQPPMSYFVSYPELYGNFYAVLESYPTKIKKWSQN